MKYCKKKSIYLAGGFQSGWQKAVIEELPEFNILDPSSHNIQDAKSYTEWDLAAIRRCDILLANMEITNPGGFALALEIGYGKALKKKIIFVDNIRESRLDKYFDMVRQSSDEVFYSLREAIDFIRKIE